MKIIFAGTPEFAATALEALIDSKHEVVAVFTQPDKKSGRGLKLTHSPVKELANLYQLPLYQPKSLKESIDQAALAKLQADVMVVAAYGMILPAAVLMMFPKGCINIHPSLLPRWRGAAPIQRTINAGDNITGVTIMQMDSGLDTGPILLQRQYILEPDETSASLHDKLAILGADTLIETLDLLEIGQVTPRSQDNALATYAHKITKEEALIDWSRKATEIECDVRAFNPWPIAHTSWKGETVRIWKAKAFQEPHQFAPRTLIKASQAGIDIATGEGILRLLELQLPGGKVHSATDFYNANHKDLIIGEHFV